MNVNIGIRPIWIPHISSPIVHFGSMTDNVYFQTKWKKKHIVIFEAYNLLIGNDWMAANW
jgi:hypothetical protein